MKSLPTLKTLDIMMPSFIMRPMRSLEDMEDRHKKADDRMKGFIARVGEERAKQAEDVLRSGKRSETGRRSTTLPELLAEAFLMQHGRNYETQLDLGFARPDFVLFDQTPGQAVIWRIQGSYWHGKSGAKDASQKERLLRSTVRGLPVAAVVDIWERRINESDGVFDLALSGQEIPD